MFSPIRRSSLYFDVVLFVIIASFTRRPRFVLKDTEPSSSLAGDRHPLAGATGTNESTARNWAARAVPILLSGCGVKWAFVRARERL